MYSSWHSMHCKSCKSKDCLVIYVRSLTTGRDSSQRNATNLFSTRSPRLQTVTGVLLSRYSCLVIHMIPEGGPTIRQNTARLV